MIKMTLLVVISDKAFETLDSFCSLFSSSSSSPCYSSGSFGTTLLIHSKYIYVINWSSVMSFEPGCTLFLLRLSSSKIYALLFLLVFEAVLYSFAILIRRTSLTTLPALVPIREALPAFARFDAFFGDPAVPLRYKTIISPKSNCNSEQLYVEQKRNC